MSRSLRATLIASCLVFPRFALAQAPGAVYPEPAPAPAAAAAAAPAPAAAAVVHPGEPAPTTNTASPAAAPASPAVELPSVVSKFKVQFYGFTELDMIRDSTQSFNELAGDGLIARPGTYGGEHGRMMFSARNSRIGFRINGPSWGDVKVSG